MARKSLAVILAAAAFMVFMPASAQAQVFTPNELSELPRIDSPQDAMRAIERSYPRLLKDAGIGGRVQLAFVVKADGAVDPASIRVMDAERDELGEAAKRAIQEIKFKPGKKDGVAVKVWKIEKVTFKL